MAIEIFNRYEHKYKLDTKTFNKVLEIMDEHMELDSHCGEHSLYTIANIYYDTKDNSLIRESLSKPAYKEKLRLRSYGVPDMDSKVFLEIKNIKKHFGEGESRVEVLKGIDIEIEKGEFCVLLGPSGSGKSTLLNIIGGIDAADEGYISINGEKTADMNEKALTLYRRKHLGYIFQMYNLIPNLNIKENIEVGAYLSDNPLDVDDLLKTLGLYEHRHKLPNQLSGGQQQRTAIGRAIVKNPDILLCDEPTGALDYNTSKEILQLIEDVNKKYGNTIIMVTHNDAIKQMADRVVKLRDGMIRKNYLNETKLTAAELDW